MTSLAYQMEMPVAEPRTTCPVCVGWGVLEATDIFCGAGGSSLGLEAVCCPACGRQLIRVTQALNHWPLAVEAHNANFPFADHDVHDIHDIPPSRFRRTALLWASPECTHHAYCGQRAETPEADRSRATFRDVVRFTEYHRYDAVIVENVIEAQLWCGVSGHGKKCSCGTSFDRWFAAMVALCYQGQIVHYNSQFALPTPQSRDRMYVVFWRNGLPAPDLVGRLQPQSWCSSCESVVRGVQSWKPSKSGVRTQPGKFEWGRYGTQYLYRCPMCSAAVAPAVVGARSIIDPTLDMQRIGDRKKDLAPKTRARIRAGVERIAGLDPIAVQVGGNTFERRPGVRVWSINDPLRTVVGTSQLALVVRYGGQTASPRAVGEPMQTITAHDRQIGLVVPAGGQEANGRSLDEPTHTIVGNDRLAVVVQNMENNVGRSLDEPTPPVTGGGNHMLVSMRNHGGVEALGTPAHTVVGGGLHHGLLVYNGVPGFVRSLEDAAGTLTARDKQSLLVPYYSTGVARPLDEPMGTVTSRDREALVFTDADVDDCLFRMLQWHELLRAQAPFDHMDGRTYELTARRRDHRGKIVGLSNELKVKMIGNMVSSPVATMLGTALVFDTLAVAA